LPIEDGQVDAATLILVMHHLRAPAAAIAEVHRVLKPGGKLIIVDMLPHDHQEYRQEMGHIHLGFSGQQLKDFLLQAGLEQILIRPLGPEEDAKGPVLFSATAVRPLN
jgi:ArsR family transcriptional regulator